MNIRTDIHDSGKIFAKINFILFEKNLNYKFYSTFLWIPQIYLFRALQLRELLFQINYNIWDDDFVLLRRYIALSRKDESRGEILRSFDEIHNGIRLSYEGK